MRFLCDVHIALQLSKRLEYLGYHSQHVNNILDKWHAQDNEIATYIDANDGILITKDQDFRNSYLLNRKPNKLIKINLGNISNTELLQIFEMHLKRISDLDKSYASFMIEINKDNVWVVTK